MASPSSSSSLSPHEMPAADGHSPTVPLPRLVSHLIAAKRALSATAHVERANTMVTTARRNIEEIAVLSARKTFLHKYVQRELRLLEGIRRRLGAIKENGGGEFKTVLRTLDSSDARVKQTLHLLKTTLVERSFQSRREPPPSTPTPTTEAEGEGAVSDPQKCLYDFVSEQGVDDLEQLFRQCIDATNDAMETFTASNEALDVELQTISDKLSLSSSGAPSRLRRFPSTSRGDTDTPDQQQESDEPSGASTESMFRSLESQATDMASHLESLVRHYDLCVSALKHTEGGGEAAAEAQAQVDIPSGLAELDRDIPHVPISEEERSQMIAVLEKDALEVEDVVQEIRDYAVEMEGHLEVLSNLVATLKREHKGLNSAVDLLEALRRALPEYIQASRTFLDEWTGQKVKIDQNMDELEALRDFYDGFLRAYDGLILEIGRRKLVKTKMEKVVSDALAKVTKLYEDVEDREAFKHELGEYLPSDIWPGLIDPPVKFELHRIGQEAGNLPDVSKEAIQRAMQRHGKRV